MIKKTIEVDVLHARNNPTFSIWFGTRKKKCKIEIKPILGDDYPCVLRKMKRQMQLLNVRDKFGFRTHSHYDIVLLVDKFKSEAITQKQLIDIFRNEHIKVVFMKDIK